MEINIYDAKTQLSKLIQMLIDKKEDEITICKNGSPVVKMTLVQKKTKRIGVAKEEMANFDITQEQLDSIDVNEFFEE